MRLWMAYSVVALGLLCALVSLPEAEAAGSASMVVQVRKTGGGALNGAEVCVGQQSNPCPNPPTRTRGNGLAVMGLTPGSYSVLVTVKHPDYKDQQRTVNFRTGMSSVRFILEPRAIAAPPPELSDGLAVQILAMDVNGPATHTSNPRVRVGWRTSKRFSSYRISFRRDDIVVVPWIDGTARTSGSAFVTIPKSFPGTRHTVYLQVKTPIGGLSAIQSASITYQKTPTQTPASKTFNVINANQIDSLIAAAKRKGYQFISAPTSAGTKCQTRTFRRLNTSNPSPYLNTKISCFYEFFKGRTLASDWRLESVLFRRRCKSCPLNRFTVVGPKRTSDPYFTVLHQPPVPGGAIELIKLVFVGPSTATSVEQALR